MLNSGLPYDAGQEENSRHRCIRHHHRLADQDQHLDRISYQCIPTSCDRLHEKIAPAVTHYAKAYRYWPTAELMINKASVHRQMRCLCSSIEPRLQHLLLVKAKARQFAIDDFHMLRQTQAELDSRLEDNASSPDCDYESDNEYAPRTDGRRLARAIQKLKKDASNRQAVLQCVYLSIIFKSEASFSPIRDHVVPKLRPKPDPRRKQPKCQK